MLTPRNTSIGRFRYTQNVNVYAWKGSDECDVMKICACCGIVRERLHVTRRYANVLPIRSRNGVTWTSQWEIKTKTDETITASYCLFSLLYYVTKYHYAECIRFCLRARLMDCCLDICWCRCAHVPTWSETYECAPTWRVAKLWPRMWCHTCTR